MILSKMFLFLIAITIIVSGMQLIGHQVLELIIVMMVVDFLTLGAMFRLEKGAPLIKNNPISVEADIVPRLKKIDKLDTIEENSNKILAQLSNSGFSNFEEKLKKQSDDITYLLDRMGRKTLELEERINKFGNGLLDSMTGLKKRVNDLENGDKKEEGQNFSSEEYVYLKTDENA
jgi:hypothetical protein